MEVKRAVGSPDLVARDLVEAAAALKAARVSLGAWVTLIFSARNLVLPNFFFGVSSGMHLRVPTGRCPIRFCTVPLIYC